MEKRFDMTNFEQSLKDHADQFSIVPSKRVWNGIYNNLHPGSKWPSFAMALVFLFTLVGVGHWNNSPKNGGEKHVVASSETQVAGGGTQVSSSEKEVAGKMKQVASSEKEVAISEKEVAGNKKQVASANLITGNFEKGKYFINKQRSANGIQLTKEAPVFSISKNILLSTPVSSDLNRLNTKENSESNRKLNGAIEDNSVLSPTEKNGDITNDKSIATDYQEPLLIHGNTEINEEKVIARMNETVTKITPINSIGHEIISINSNSVDEDNNEASYEMESLSGRIIDVEMMAQKQPLVIKRKKNEKITWTYFVTPTITTVYFTGKPLYALPTSNLPSIIVRPGQMGDNMVYNAKIGFETGVEMAYKFADNWQLTTGSNLSYSGYRIIADPVHPAFAHLLLKNRAGNIYSKDYITHFGNSQGQAQTSLNNFSLQASIPIGLQYTVWGNKNLQINIASTIAPSFIINSNAYVLSSDGKNYINDPDLMRKINLTGDFGSFVTFSSKQIKWHIGPSIRYQILSTYQNIYTVKEHLLDYGIRIGISK